MPETMRVAGDHAKALPKKINFTIASLTASKCPAGKDRSWLYDRKTPGLSIMVTANGSKAFYFLKKVNGRFVRFRLGGFPELHLDHARRAVIDLAGGVARGIDPMEQRRADRAAMTLGDLHKYYMDSHAKVHKRRWQDDEAQFRRYLTGWKGRTINSISRPDVQALHAKIGRDNGQMAANRLLALLSKMFNVALDFGIEKNPARGVKKFRETSRSRFVGADEMPRLLAAIDAEPDPFGDFFKLALLTGARRGNLQSMAWAEINLETATWTIPGMKAKGHEAIVIPLVDEAVRILNDRQDRRRHDELWVFPSHGDSGHLSEPKTAWGRVLERAGLSDLHLHDLRRTMGSWQAAQGTSLHVIGKSLGHRNVATTAIYARLNLDPVRASVTAAAAAMLAAGSPVSGLREGGK